MSWKEQGYHSSTELVDKYRQVVETVLRPKWDYMVAFLRVDDTMDALKAIVGELSRVQKTMEQFKSSIGENEKEVDEELFRIMRYALFNRSSVKSLEPALNEILHLSFALYCHLGGVAQPGRCPMLQTMFRKFFELLNSLRLIDFLIKDRILIGANQVIEAQVRQHYPNLLVDSQLDDLKSWAKRRVIPWVHDVIGESNNKTDYILNEVHRAVGEFLIDQSFNLIIIEYPDSLPLVQDLTRCVEHLPGLRILLKDRLRKDVEKRLLHLGASTADILRGYTSAVEALRMIDPACTIMYTVCDVIRVYVRSRHDILRGIVAFMITEKRDEVAQMLREGPGHYFDEQDLEGLNIDVLEEEDEPETAWKFWNPDPIDAPQKYRSRQARHRSDVVTMLIAIYGSKDLFIKEYRRTLAHRLLNEWNSDVSAKLDGETQYLELLKLRFGESDLHQCEVMINDMRQSQRMNCHVRSESDRVPIAFNSRLISAIYWPTIHFESIKVPSMIAVAMERYEEAFVLLKTRRKLNWLPSLGRVTMTVQIFGLSTMITIPPAQATVLTAFLQKESWTMKELCEKLEIRNSTIRPFLKFWQTTGLLLPKTGAQSSQSSNSNPDEEIWSLTSRAPDMESVRTQANALWQESDDLSEEGMDQLEEAMEAFSQYWTYLCIHIFKASSKAHPISAERVTGSLKVMANSNPNLSSGMVNQQNTAEFLYRQERAGLLAYTKGGYYLIPK